jgi:hypothetical protein
MSNLTTSNTDPYTYFYSNLINSMTGTPVTPLTIEINVDFVLKECKYIKYNYGFKETQCPISLDDFKDGDLLIELPCKHIFLETNIKEWVKEKQNCPVCRHDLIHINNDAGNSEDELVRSQSNITTQIDSMILYLSNQLRNSENVGEGAMDAIFEIY